MTYLFEESFPHVIFAGFPQNSFPLFRTILIIIIGIIIIMTMTLIMVLIVIAMMIKILTFLCFEELNGVQPMGTTHCPKF